MPQFRFEGFDAKGGSVEGQIEAATSQDALLKLGEQSLTLTKLEDLSGVSGDIGSKAPPMFGFGQNSPVKVGEQILIIRELATLLRAGITLVDAIDSLALSRVNTTAGVGLRKAHRSLNAGTPFVKALEETKIEFPPYLFQLAATGEMTGKLSEIGRAHV